MTSIAFLIPTLDEIGGAERQVLLLAKAFAARGWHVTVITLSGHGSAASTELTAAGASFLSLQMRKAWIDPRGWIRYLAWHTVNHPDIVHAHLPHATFFARCVRLFAPVPVLIDTIHTIHTGSRTRQLFYRFTGRLTTHVTCVAQSVAEAVLAAGMAPDKYLSVLPNGIEIRNRPLPRNSTQPQPFLWVAVGRLAPVKDYATLLRAFARLPGQPRLSIAGAGPEKAALLQLAQELDIDDRVHFAGFLDNIQPLLATADAFVLSSLWEGLPVSILEASAAALPVVATETAGAREAIRSGESGLLVSIGDPAALAQAMTAIMAMSPKERFCMGHAGYGFVCSQFVLPVIADRWTQLYIRLLDHHPKPCRWR